jgi:hypothetical protein
MDGKSPRNHLLEIASHDYLAIASGTTPELKPDAVTTPSPLKTRT